ncbi:MAG: antibiotic transport system ATP-binding protein [Bacillota bacterium]|nr:MAG: antibiotic transport system ATP-binding protein [Bacillota bacterium]MBS3950684.1 ABC transporter ATP-binding protein [Peptococcaceae bacterium]
MSDAVFQVQDLRFAYPRNKEETIKGISFEFSQGEIFGFLGPSGAGKSTTQKLLIKMLKDYKGQALYRGKDLKAYGKEFFSEIGVGFEMPVHFSKLTALENIEFFKRLYPRHTDVESLMKRIGLWEHRNKKLSEYSKGMKMRLNFVRALLNDPKVLFLDEPTNGLDPHNARIIKDIILEFRAAGGTAFLTTHLMHDADELCDRVAFIAEGEIREIDSPKNLKLRFGQRTITVEYEDGERCIETFDMTTLRKNELFFDIMRTKNLTTIHSGETTLDDIFIKVTGVKLHG